MVALDNFRGDVVWSPSSVFQLLVFVQVARGPEVNHFDVRIWTGVLQQQVFRFQVSVYNAKPMTVIHSFQDLPHYHRHFELRHHLLGQQPLEYFPSRTELSYQVESG